MPSLPTSWAGYLDLENPRCAPIVGRFDNHGEHVLQDGTFADDGLLAEDVLARQLPTGRPADRLILQSDTGASLLAAQVVGQLTRKIAIEVSCDGGWHTFSFERSGAFVGGGMKEERFQHVAYFREDSKGRLVARVVTDARYRSVSGTVSESSGENWYRFEPDARD